MSTVHLIRCKLRVLEDKRRLDVRYLDLKPVIAKSATYPGGSEENARFFKATPTGQCELWYAPGAAPIADIGEYVYVDMNEDPAGDWTFADVKASTGARTPTLNLQYNHDRELRSAQLTLQIENPEAWAAFDLSRLGTRWLVSFVRAPSPEAGSFSYP